MDFRDWCFLVFFIIAFAGIVFFGLLINSDQQEIKSLKHELITQRDKECNADIGVLFMNDVYENMDVLQVQLQRVVAELNRIEKHRTVIQVIK